MKESLRFLERRPKSFDDCIVYARQKFEKFFNHDIRQLLHVYPLDSKTKDGSFFWSLPKRPPVPLIFDPANPLHSGFIASMACLIATVYSLELPTKQPRTEQFRRECGEIAAKIEVTEFVPND